MAYIAAFLCFRLIRYFVFVSVILWQAASASDNSVLLEQAEGSRDAEHNEPQSAINIADVISINGIKQALDMRGDNKSSPVILYLHGGPGYATTPIGFDRLRAWEKNFIVVHWDQRGAGKTRCLNPEYDLSAASFEDFVSDTIEVVRYLRKRLEKDKIIILGHSWGSLLGVHLIKQKPEWVSAYIGAGQISYNWEQEIYGYDFALREAYAKNDKADIDELEKIKPYPEDVDYVDKLRVQRKYVIEYGGSLYGADSYEKLANDAEAAGYPGYTSEDWKCWREAMEGRDHRQLMEKQYAKNTPFANLPLLGLDFEVPIFFFLGRHDEHISMRLGAKYFSDINAPYKRLILFDQSAHSPPLEEPDEFLEALRTEVLPILEAREQ